MGTTQVSFWVERGKPIQVQAPAAEMCLVNNVNGQVAAGAGPKNIATGRTCLQNVKIDCGCARVLKSHGSGVSR